jgi:hypothetical protein
MNEPLLSSLATAGEVQEVVKQLVNGIINEHPEVERTHPSAGENESWTKTVWKSFELLRQRLGKNWEIHPPTMPAGKGRGKGEFLLDFVLFDNRLGPRIACESEMGVSGLSAYEWAFSKLAAVKSDIKIFLVEHPISGSNLPPEIEAIAKRKLSNTAHLDPREHYVIIQCDGPKWNCLHWSPPNPGPLQHSEISFKSLITIDASEPDTTRGNKASLQ